MSDPDDEIVQVSVPMLRAGIERLREQSFAASQEDIVGLIYMAMEYQRRREDASFVKS